MVYVRELARPRRELLRRWEVRLEEGSPVIGWLSEHTIGRGSIVFVEALAVDPFGDLVSLESSPDWDERLKRLEFFHDHPESELNRHWRPSPARRAEFLSRLT